MSQRYYVMLSFEKYHGSGLVPARSFYPHVWEGEHRTSMRKNIEQGFTAGELITTESVILINAIVFITLGH